MCVLLQNLHKDTSLERFIFPYSAMLNGRKLGQFINIQAASLLCSEGSPWWDPGWDLWRRP